MENGEVEEHREEEDEKRKDEELQHPVIIICPWTSSTSGVKRGG